MEQGLKNGSKNSHSERGGGMGEKVNGRSNPDIMDSHCGGPQPRHGDCSLEGLSDSLFSGAVGCCNPFFPWSYLKQALGKNPSWQLSSFLSLLLTWRKLGAQGSFYLTWIVLVLLIVSLAA